MKIKYLFFGLASLLVAGCANEEFNPTPSANGVRVFADMPSTRVSFGEGDAVTYAKWQNGDVISLSTDIQSNLQYTASVAEEGSTVAEFLPGGDALQNNYKKVVYACYPSAAMDMEAMTVPLPDTQSYNDLEFRPFVYAIDTLLSERLSLHFHHPYAYLKLTFTEGILPPDTFSIGAVTIASDEVIAAASGTFNFSTQAVAVVEGSKTMLIDRLGGDGSGHALANSPYTLYVPILPQSEGTKITIKACYTLGSGEENRYPYYTMEKAVPTGGFQAGHVYTLTMGDEVEAKEPGIYNLQDLIAFSEATNLGGELAKWKNQDGIINIFADIDMSGAGNWAGIPSIGADEVLEGNGHKILNWKVEGYNYSTDCGFVRINVGVIRNLTIEEGCIFSGCNMGGSVCVNNNGGTISNCISYASVKANLYFGGICGDNAGLIENCSNYSDIHSESWAGGIVCRTDASSVISNCCNYGNIEAFHAGGISSKCQGSIVECINEGASVLTIGEYSGDPMIGRPIAGGISAIADGYYYDGFSILGCINKADVSSSEEAGIVGGIVGISTNFEIANCQNSGNVSGKTVDIGGICGILERGSLSGNTNRGTVNGVAGTDANEVGSDDSGN